MCLFTHSMCIFQITHHLHLPKLAGQATRDLQGAICQGTFCLWDGEMS